MCTGLEHTGDRGHLSLGRLPLCALSPIPQPSLAGSVLQGLRGCISQAPLASGWVWLVRGAGESWEGGPEEGEAGHSPLSCSPPPLPSPRPPPLSPPPPAPISAAQQLCCCRGRLCQPRPLSVPLAPGCQQLPAGAYLPGSTVGFSIFHHQSNQFHVLNSLF